MFEATEMPIWMTMGLFDQCKECFGVFIERVVWGGIEW